MLLAVPTCIAFSHVGKLAHFVTRSIINQQCNKNCIKDNKAVQITVYQMITLSELLKLVSGLHQVSCRSLIQSVEKWTYPILLHKKTGKPTSIYSMMLVAWSFAGQNFSSKKQINVTHILKLHMKQKRDKSQQHTIYLVSISEQQIKFHLFTFWQWAATEEGQCIVSISHSFNVICQLPEMYSHASACI